MAKRGRPPFRVTRTLQRKVEELVSCGMSQDDVARVIGCSIPTLEKHFPDELKTGRARKRAEVIALLFKSARSGNVSAQKKLEDMTGVASIGRAPIIGTAAAEPKRGKKEQAMADAQRPDQTTPLGQLMAKRSGLGEKLH